MIGPQARTREKKKRLKENGFCAPPHEAGEISFPSLLIVEIGGKGKAARIGPFSQKGNEQAGYAKLVKHSLEEK